MVGDNRVFGGRLLPVVLGVLHFVQTGDYSGYDPSERPSRIDSAGNGKPPDSSSSEHESIHANQFLAAGRKLRRGDASRSTGRFGVYGPGCRQRTGVSFQFVSGRPSHLASSLLAGKQWRESTAGHGIARVGDFRDFECGGKRSAGGLSK